MVDEQDVQWLMVTTGSGEEVVFFTYAVLYYIRRCKAQQQQYDEANVGLNNAGTYVYDTTTQKLPRRKQRTYYYAAAMLFLLRLLL